MALSSAVVWEVRNGGSDTNGGGFKAGASGTDWSQQDSAQYSVTDGVTAGTTTITSATANFGTDVVGNLIYVQGGTGSVTAGWYEITARTNSTTITVDRSTGLTAGTGVTLNIGGALASPGLAFAKSVSGNTIYLKYSATPYTISTSTAGSGGPLKYIQDQNFIGYDTTRSLSNTDANRPTIKAGVNSISILTGVDAFSRRNRFRNFILDGDQPTRSSVNGFYGLSAGGDQAYAELVKVVNCTTGFHTVSHCFRCEAASCTDGFNSCTVHTACISRSNSGRGYRGQGGQVYMLCLAYSNTGVGFDTEAFGGTFINCTSVSNGSHGFNTQNDSRTQGYSVNSIAVGNGGYGWNSGSGHTLKSCASKSNTGGRTSGSPQDLDAVTLTVDPFTNSGSSDFSLNNTAGGGADCRAAGFPGVFPGGLTTGYLDIGAVQHQDSGGGGGSSSPYIIGS